MTTTLKCSHCGGDLGPGDGFCALCGAVVDSLWGDMVDRLRRATLGEFEIGRELGRGGMAAVFLAHEVALDRDVAIKVMSPALLLGDGMVDRFRHEAITIANLHHPNIVSVYSVRQAEGLPFFVMQYVRGRSLDRVIRQAGRLPLPAVRSILHQVGSALAYAHRRRVIHRDIKPGNILIDGDGNAVVTDFGIAKAAESPTQTMTGALIGTPAYMSPEQCRGSEVSGASDQYALGAVAYEMLTGAPPFSGSTFTILQAHVEREPPPLREHLPDCPPEMESAILRMLAKDPAARWPTVADAMAALGTELLADDDPLRLALTQVVSRPSPPASGDSTGTGRSRQSAAALGGTAAPVGSVAILPPPAGLEVGDSFVLVAQVRGQRGTHLPSGTVVWSTDAPDVIKLDPGGGVAVAVGAGCAELSATCQGVRAVLPVDVSPPRADEITIDPPEHGVRAGDEIHVDASARDKRGRLIARPVAWETADPGVATVTESGLLLAQAPGLARISALLDGVRATIAIPILPARVAAIRVGEAPAALAGESFALAATPVDRWGGPLPDRTVLWSSSDVRVAVVAAGGLMHALRPGSVVLTASCEGISESLKLNVGIAPATAPPATAPAPAASAPVARSASRRGSHTRWAGRLVAASIGAALAGGVFWLFGRPEPAVVAAATPEPAGYVSYGGPDTTATEVGSVAITRRPVRSLRPEGSFQLAAEVRDQAGRPLSGAGVEWASSDSLVVRVHPENGWIRAGRPGRAHVVASSSGRRDSTLVTVRLPPPKPAPAALAIVPVAPLRAGESATLSTAEPEAGGAPRADSSLTWSSSDPWVATVDPRTGELRALAPGTALITVTAGTDSASSEVAVLPAAVAGVIIQGARPLAVGERLPLVGIPTDAQGRALRDRLITWKSSDTTLLHVDPMTGLLAALAPGTVAITATSEGGSGVARVTVFARDEGERGGAAASPGGADSAILAGVEECYDALLVKDADRVAKLYHPATKSDSENLKRLRRILAAQESGAIVGERVDGEWQIGEETATMDFSVRLVWHDESGGRRSSDPLLRAQFSRQDSGWTMSSCRIVGNPNL